MLVFNNSTPRNPVASAGRHPARAPGPGVLLCARRASPHYTPLYEVTSLPESGGDVRPPPHFAAWRAQAARPSGTAHLKHESRQRPTPLHTPSRCHASCARPTAQATTYPRGPWCCCLRALRAAPPAAPQPASPPATPTLEFSAPRRPRLTPRPPLPTHGCALSVCGSGRKAVG